MKIRGLILGSLLVIGSASFAHAMESAEHSDTAAPMSMQDSLMHPKPIVADSSSSDQSVYADAMNKMHESMMSVPVTGDVDEDFINGMIPHHQGAIDMAKVALEKSNDPFVRKLAGDIVEAQEKEIAAMNAWKQEHAEHSEEE